MTRIAGLLFLALTLGVSACSGDDATPSSQETSGDSASDTPSLAPPTSGAPSTESSTVPPVYPIEDVCALMSIKDVSDVLGNDVLGSPTPGSCTYTPSSGAGSPSVITVQEDVGGGLDSARAAAEAELGGAAQPLDVAGNEGFVVFGLDAELTVAQGSAAVNGLLISASTAGGGAEDIIIVIEAMLELAAASV